MTIVLAARKKSVTTKCLKVEPPPLMIALPQDAQHQKAMGLLHTAERSSLASEIRQLRSQLLHVSEAQPSKRKEGGGGADGAVAGAVAAAAGPSDRLLAEELKVELSQTKLELETTLKAQHKHLKELDTLRCER